MRWESEHSYFRQIVRVVRNCNNLPFTLTTRHQARLSSRLATCEGEPDKKFLYQGHEIKPGTRLLLENLPNAELLYPFVDEIDRPEMIVMRTTQVKCYGTIYEHNSMILLRATEEDLPTFGIVNEIFVFNQLHLLCYIILDTNYFEENLNAYSVSKPHNQVRAVISIDNLIFPHVLP